ncbi:hypothetical protein [Microbulbifer discodermiae]
MNTAVPVGNLLRDSKVIAALRRHSVLVPQHRAGERLRIPRGVGNRAQYS